jgi:hypothetical protein
VLVTDEGEESGRRALNAYALANYGLPLAELERIQLLVTGTAAEVAAGLARYAAAGVRHVVLRVGAMGLPTQLDQLERIAAVALR